MGSFRKMAFFAAAKGSPWAAGDERVCTLLAHGGVSLFGLGKFSARAVEIQNTQAQSM
jgi:hypothetical protein